MTTNEIREKFLDFFKAKGHQIVPSSSLIPNDPSVLFTTAGMQQFKGYYTGELDPVKDFNSLNTASVQKCMRTSDIDEVGDESHLTFFEMLGNFSFGGYFKKEAIEYANQFIQKELGLKINYVSVFGGGDGIPADNESERIWQSIDSKIRIKKFGKEDNFWGPTGSEGPCGPTTEIYIGDVEIWNIVFNEFYCDRNGKMEPLESKGVDTGMGLERLAMAVQGVPTVFDTDLLSSVLAMLPDKLDIRTKRVITDHLRSVVFLASENIMPSNKEQGYVLRRLMRRVITYSYLHDIGGEIHKVLEEIVGLYKRQYQELDYGLASSIFEKEEEKFRATLKHGLKKLEKTDKLDAKAAFGLYESYGLPYEIIKEIGGAKASGLAREDFDKEFKRHQQKSRESSKGKFGGHGLVLDTGELKAADKQEMEKVIRLHTATHLLHAALRNVLGENVRQDGSDITAQRLRFDFTFPRKLTDEEKGKIEAMVNQAIKRDFEVWFEEMPYDDALKTGAMSFFKQRYPEIVKVYTIGDRKSGEVFSKELCAGPHVRHTGEIGRFRILKEEALSSSSRRIRATVE